MVEMTVSATFGEMEAALAEMHEIASEKRTSFQARLKHFNRIGLPTGLEMVKGKTAHYGAGHMIEMAIAVEFTQLGLQPDRLLAVIRQNTFPIWTAISMAAHEIKKHPDGFDPEEEREDDPMSMFLFFDPTALAPLMPGAGHDEDNAAATLFYGGYGIVRENIVKWTSGYAHRLSLLNVTAMLDKFTSAPIGKARGKSLVEWRRAFMDELETAADYMLDFPDEDTDDATIVRWARNHLEKLFYQDSVNELVAEIVRRTGIPVPRAYAAIQHQLNIGALPSGEENDGNG